MAKRPVDEGTAVGVQGGRNQGISGELLRGLRAGSSQAWARLYDELAPGIHRFAVSGLSGDAETAQEVVVETLADAARRIGRFDPEKSSLSAWVYGIARRVVQIELRKRSRRKSVPTWAQVSFEDLGELRDSEDLAARAAARLDAQRRIREAAHVLSESETELLSLSSIEELPGREIAAVVGRSQQAVRVALHRARQKVRRIGIEGALVVGATRRTPGGFYPYSHVFSGSEDRLVGEEFGISCELSPVSDEIAYCLHGSGVQEYPAVSGHVWKARRDGSGAVNLSEAVGLRGINLYPRWSPDAALIAFTHWDEPGAELSGPGEAWVMKADGSEARRVAPREVLAIGGCPCWSPDGSCLSYDAEVAVPAALPGAVDLWGRAVRISTDSRYEWSPDGTCVALTRVVRAEAEGEPGHWRQLVLMAADGSGRRVLVEQFISDAERQASHPTQEQMEATPAFDYLESALCKAGPTAPRWSPRGDKIAFLAGLPFQPGPGTDLRVDVWIYDLMTRRLTKITNEPHLQHSLSWGWRAPAA